MRFKCNCLFKMTLFVGGDFFQMPKSKISLRPFGFLWSSETGSFGFICFKKFSTVVFQQILQKWVKSVIFFRATATAVSHSYTLEIHEGHSLESRSIGGVDGSSMDFPDPMFPDEPAVHFPV